VRAYVCVREHACMCICADDKDEMPIGDVMSRGTLKACGP
jgi:hypothetical protein